MSSTLVQIIIGLFAAVVAVAAVAGIVYYIHNNRTIPSGPLAPIPVPATTNITFFNSYPTKTIYIIPVYGSATDSRGWTNWPQVPGSGDTTVKTVPYSADLVPTKLQPLQTVTMSVLTAGMASTNFIIRLNCDETTMICELGDSAYVPGLDGPTPNDLKRDKTSAGAVPFKPAIDTRLELTWGCAYVDSTLCGVNPSCITDPAAPGCIALETLMNESPAGTKFNTNGLLYKPDGRGGYVNVPLTGGALTSPTYFDITCVDGFTVPMVVQVKRPDSGIASGSKCTLRDGSAPLDAPVAGWQLPPLIDTRHLADLSVCPTSEVLWPSPRTVAIVPPSTTGDGYNNHANVTQFDMPWVTQLSLPTAKLNASFLPGSGSVTNLTQYRTPQEVAAVPSMGFSIHDRIGCSSPCSVLVSNRGVSVMYPKVGGHFSTEKYIAVGADPFVTTDRGVSEVCCKPPGGTVVADSNKQCNTSTWWTPPEAGPAANPTTVNVNYNYGFYVNVFAPSPGADQPWWNGTTSINPYAGGPGGSEVAYVGVVRNGASGQAQTTRAYSYAHDDAWSTLLCDTAAPVNIRPTDGRGEHYARYDVRITIGLTLPP